MSGNSGGAVKFLQTAKLLKIISIVAVALVVTFGAPATTFAAASTVWTAHPASDETGVYRGIAWSPELGIFVAAANGFVMTSPDGITWTTQTTPSASGSASTWRSVAWSPQLNLFVVVGSTSPGTSQNVITSPDGINWTLRSQPDSRVWSAVVWSPEQSQFVATVAPASGSMTSPDGITWTNAPVMTVVGGARTVIWAAQDSQYVATRSPSAVIHTSPDGITWTQHVAPLASFGVAYAPSLDTYVAVGGSGLMTSSDAATWTTQTSSVTNLRSVVWSAENNEFVAVGPGGIVSSPDGITWTAETSPAANSWEALAWSPSLFRYVAVSLDGTNRTMTGLVPTLPSAPISLSASTSGSKVNLTWTQPTFDGNSAIAGYRIERSTNGGAYTTLVTNTASTSTTYTDATVASDVSYAYRVYALNAQGASVASNVATIKVSAVQGTLADTGESVPPIMLTAGSLIIGGGFLLTGAKVKKLYARNK